MHTLLLECKHRTGLQTIKLYLPKIAYMCIYIYEIYIIITYILFGYCPLLNCSSLHPMQNLHANEERKKEFAKKAKKKREKKILFDPNI